MLMLTVAPAVMFAKPLLEVTQNVTCPTISSRLSMVTKISVAVKFSSPAHPYPMGVDVSPPPILLVTIAKTGVIGATNASFVLQTT